MHCLCVQCETVFHASRALQVLKCHHTRNSLDAAVNLARLPDKQNIKHVRYASESYQAVTKRKEDKPSAVSSNFLVYLQVKEVPVVHRELSD